MFRESTIILKLIGYEVETLERTVKSIKDLADEIVMAEIEKSLISDNLYDKFKKHA